MDIRNKLIAIRSKKGYTKKKVAEMTGIPYTTYIKYESGERKDVSMDAIVKLADCYGVTTDYLLGRESQTDPVAMLNLDLGEDEIIREYMTLPTNIRAIILDALEQLAEARRRGFDKGGEKIPPVPQHERD